MLPSVDTSSVGNQPMSVTSLTDSKQTDDYDILLSGPHKNFAFISPMVKEKAVRGDYIDLEDFHPQEFLSPSGSSKLHMSLHGNSGQLTFHRLKPGGEIKNLFQWLQAWNNYEWLLMQSNGSLYSSLASYRSFIQRCSEKFVWPAVHSYDMKFRAALAQSDHQFDFSEADHDLYVTTFDSATVRPDIVRCYRCQSIDHRVAHCPFPTTQSPQAKIQADVHPTTRVGGCRYGVGSAHKSNSPSGQCRPGVTSALHTNYPDPQPPRQPMHDISRSHSSTIGPSDKAHIPPEPRGVPPWPPSSCR